MELISVNEMAEKWDVSPKRIINLCLEKLIPDAVFIKNTWFIPKTFENVCIGMELKNTNNLSAKPFVKWAGGKSQLIKEIKKCYPMNYGIEINKYAEPFIGGGAVFFDIVNHYTLKEIYISDTNHELICTYEIIKNRTNDLIKLLRSLQDEYMGLNEDERKIYYYKKREVFNNIKNLRDSFRLEIAAHFIFLNKTCFNGLYRVNSKGLFNVPLGNYKNPLICDSDNLILVAEKLKNVDIVYGDYRGSYEFIDKNTFVYIDPPYRPISKTSNFNAYNKESFDDKAHMELASFNHKLNKKGAKLIISNSDPQNCNNEDDFFDKLYKGYNIKRVKASRMINCNGKLRGEIQELLISNF